MSSCPDCGFFCSNDEILAEHLNEHEIAAANQQNSLPSNSSACFCPICDLFQNSQTQLEQHLRNVHSLSVSGAKNSGFDVEFDPDWAECPVCGSEIDRKLIEDHVKQHFDVGDSANDSANSANLADANLSQDERLARQLQAAESSSFAEELQLQQLKESYGMDDKHGGYAEQGLAELQRMYNDGRIAAEVL